MDIDAIFRALWTFSCLLVLISRCMSAGLGGGGVEVNDRVMVLVMGDARLLLRLPTVMAVHPYLPFSSASLSLPHELLFISSLFLRFSGYSDESSLFFPSLLLPKSLCSNP